MDRKGIYNDWFPGVEALSQAIKASWTSQCPLAVVQRRIHNKCCPMEHCKQCFLLKQTRSKVWLVITVWTGANNYYRFLRSHCSMWNASQASSTSANRYWNAWYQQAFYISGSSTMSCSPAGGACMWCGSSAPVTNAATSPIFICCRNCAASSADWPTVSTVAQSARNTCKANTTGAMTNTMFSRPLLFVCITRQSCR